MLVTYIGHNTGKTRCDLLAAYDGIAWRYWDDDEMLDEVMVEITHWMPIEPPKEDGEMEVQDESISKFADGEWWKEAQK